MKNLFFVCVLFMIISCNPNKIVYWCGDHPCINKKEKEAYFKKTMIVEIKEQKSKNYKEDSEIKKIIQQAQLNEKKRTKNEKNLIKQTNSEEKRRIKEEKDLAKQVKLEEKRRIKEEKKLSKNEIIDNQKEQLKKSVDIDASTENTKIEQSKFSEFVKKITKKNALKQYPDINDIPN